MNTAIVNGRVLNHRPDSWKTIQASRDAGPLLRAKAAPFVAGLALPYIISILNQLSLGSCTGHGAAYNFRAAMARAGVTDPALVSRLWLYWWGRAFDHDTNVDDGAQVGNVFLGAEMYGLCPEAVWPYDVSAFKGPPPPECWRAGFDFLPQGHRINSTGDQLIEDITAALGQGRFVTFGSAVSNEYCSNAFDATVPLQAPTGADIAGLHCQNVIDREPSGAFRILNQWGEDWGGPVAQFTGGSALFSEDFLLDGNSGDFRIVDLVPTTNIVDPSAGGAS